MHLRQIFAALLLSLLAACGGDQVRGLPDGFGDSKPHKWRGTVPADYEVHGVDVSRWQGSVDWFRLRQTGIAFAFIKATEGGDVADPLFADHWQGAARAGLPRGAYHFYFLCRPAAEQARWFIDHVPAEPGALPPVLDIEWNHQSRLCRQRPAPEIIRSEILTYLALVGAHYGQRPLIYTTVDFWRDNELWRIGGEEFWLRSVAGHPRKTYPGQDWSFWQYTGTGVVQGVSGAVDLNAFAGSEADWARWRARRSL